jgi:hypothetical protein
MRICGGDFLTGLTLEDKRKPTWPSTGHEIFLLAKYKEWESHCSIPSRGRYISVSKDVQTGSKARRRGGKSARTELHLVSKLRMSYHPSLHTLSRCDS